MNKSLVFIIITILLIIIYYFLNQQQNKEINNDLIIEILEEGSGEPAKNKDRMTVHYTGWLTDGTKFDSSLDRGQPFVFTLGIGQVIKGWDEGVLNAKIGEKRKLTIPPSMAYGESGMKPAIPPNSTLIFEIEIINIQ